MTISSNNEIREQAEEAKNYAKQFILKGSTQLENNSFDARQRNHLTVGIENLRQLVWDCDEKNQDSILEYDEVTTEFYETIEKSKKYSLGNCKELAMLALDYIATKTNLDAEVYNIDNVEGQYGADHGFLVIGRAKDSDPNQPETWGNNAYICDPWSNQVYPASEYRTQLKNFFSIPTNYSTDYTNMVQDFDPNLHRLVPAENYNTTYIRKHNSTEHMAKALTSFHQKQQMILDATHRLDQRLDKIADRLKTQYDENDPKYKAIMEKKKHVGELISNLEKKISQAPTSITNYNDIHHVLNKELVGTLQLTKDAIKSLKADQDVLAKPRETNAFKAFVIKFMKIKPKSEVETKKASNEFLAELHNISKKP